MRFCTCREPIRVSCFVRYLSGQLIFAFKRGMDEEIFILHNVCRKPHTCDRPQGTECIEETFLRPESPRCERGSRKHGNKITRRSETPRLHPLHHTQMCRQATVAVELTIEYSPLATSSVASDTRPWHFNSNIPLFLNGQIPQQRSQQLQTAAWQSPPDQAQLRSLTSSTMYFNPRLRTPLIKAS